MVCSFGTVFFRPPSEAGKIRWAKEERRNVGILDLLLSDAEDGSSTGTVEQDAFPSGEELLDKAIESAQQEN